jgi:hypothetical protein
MIFRKPQQNENGSKQSRKVVYIWKSGKLHQIHVVPLRGTGEVCGSESVGCAALHARLFKCDRYAVGSSRYLLSAARTATWLEGSLLATLSLTHIFLLGDEIAVEHGL